jgi:hypothetical protein
MPLILLMNFLIYIFILIHLPMKYELRLHMIDNHDKEFFIRIEIQFVPN